MEKKRVIDLGTHATCGLIFKASVRDFDKIIRVIGQDFPEVFIIFQKLTAERLWLKVGGSFDD